MAITDILKDSDDTWPRTPFAVVLGKEINSLEEALTYQMEHDIAWQKLNTDTDGQGNDISALLGSGLDAANPVWFSKPYYQDTRVGGNDAINCLWQFNRDDDIVHPITQNREGDSQGLGRVYNEMIQANQHIVWLTFGVTEFARLTDFYLDAIKNDLVKLMVNGEASDFTSQVGTLMGDIVGLAVTLPLMPLIWIAKVVRAGTAQKVTKYYDFRQSMLLYYTIVNSILVHLSVNLGLYAESKVLEEQPTSSGYMPKFMQQTGPDIFAIMQRRSLAAGISHDNKTTEARLKEASKSDPNRETRWYELFIGSEVSNTALGGTDYIGFRIDKSDENANESFSNQTGESSLASTLNSKVTSAMDSAFGTGGFLNEVKGVLTGLADIAGAGSLVATYFGTSFIDIPDVWKGSSFGKSYSLTLPLRAPYGDTVSIMQSLYIPLACLLAGTLPRATGQSSFTSPFVCRAYCKGQFAAPLAMIDSISIRRGSSEYGWNNNNLPTSIDVSLTIKDLSPAIFLAIATDNTSWTATFGQNSSFQEYLLTLSGMGLNERILFWNNIKRRAQILCQLRESTSGHLGFIGGNPHYWQMRVGESKIARLIGAISPYDKLPRN